MDIVGPLPKSNGYTYIIVFVCACTKWIEALPLRSPDAENSAHALFYGVVLRHGCSGSLITDRGTNFTSVLFSELSKLLQIEKIHTTAHHPEGTLVKSFRLQINDEQDN